MTRSLGRSQWREPRLRRDLVSTSWTLLCRLGLALLHTFSSNLSANAPPFNYIGVVLSRILLFYQSLESVTTATSSFGLLDREQISDVLSNHSLFKNVFES